MSRDIRKANIEDLEKQTRRWWEELCELWRFQRENKEKIQLEKPRFVGYDLKFRLTSLGKSNLDEKVKKFFKKHKRTFFTTNKKLAKNIEPSLEEKRLYPLFWPVILFSPRLFKLSGIKFTEIVKNPHRYSYSLYTLDIKEHYFRKQVKKKFLYEIPIEDAEVDSRIDFLREKLFNQKLYNKYLKNESYKNPEEWTSSGVFLETIAGYSPSKPYYRAAAKTAANLLITEELDDRSNT